MNRRDKTDSGINQILIALYNYDDSSENVQRIRHHLQFLSLESATLAWGKITRNFDTIISDGA